MFADFGKQGGRKPFRRVGPAAPDDFVAILGEEFVQHAGNLQRRGGGLCTFTRIATCTLMLARCREPARLGGDLRRIEHLALVDAHMAAALDQDFAVDELRAAIADAALAVPCFGYRSVTLPIQAASGEWLELNADQGGVAVGDDSRLMLSNGSCLANVFGIGLGTGYRPPASMGGEPNFSGQINSLWLYQNDIGAAIHRAIQGLGDKTPNALAA